MKNLIAICLLFTLTGCATIRRHPVASAIVGGVVVGVVVGVKYHDKRCPSTYDGKPYQGTPWGPYPCPQYAETGKR
jgi:hypothetical protein